MLGDEFVRPQVVIVAQHRLSDTDRSSHAGGTTACRRYLEEHCEVVWSRPRAGDWSEIDGVVIDSPTHDLSRDVPVHGAAVAELGALCNEAERDRFLTILFAAARLRAVEQRGERSALVSFHARYKYALLAHDERGMRELGRIVAGMADWPWPVTTVLYRNRFLQAFARPASVGGQVNALAHAFGHVSAQLTAADRECFLGALNDLSAGQTSPAAVRRMLRGWAVRCGVTYLLEQACLAAYPELEPEAAGRGRQS